MNPAYPYRLNAWLLDEADVAVGHAIAAAPNGDAVVVGRLGQDDGFVARYVEGPRSERPTFENFTTFFRALDMPKHV